MRKIKFALLSEQFVARDDQHRFSLHGVNPTLARTSSFFRRLSLSFAPIAPLPPDGFVLVRWEGGLCGDFCACRSPLPAAWRVGRATWSIDFLLEKKIRRPISLQDVYRRAFMYGNIVILSPLSLSLSIFIICRSVCSGIISHTFSGIVWQWGLRGWELGTSQSLAKWNGHYILRSISWGVSRGCKDRAFNTYNGSCQIGLSSAKS